jgi:hypothetical protein
MSTQSRGHQCIGGTAETTDDRPLPINKESPATAVQISLAQLSYRPPTLRVKGAWLGSTEKPLDHGLGAEFAAGVVRPSPARLSSVVREGPVIRSSASPMATEWRICAASFRWSGVSKKSLRW